MKRRDFIKTSMLGLSGLGLSGLGLSACGGGGMMGSIDLQPSLNTGVFTRPFFTPPEALSSISGITGNKVFDLSMQTGKKQFTGQGTTATMGINGQFLAPTLRMTKGETVDLNVFNALGQETTLHWHGMRVPSNMDGGPHQTISPNSIWKASYPVIQRASTNWYHPHAHGSTGSQVYAGLAGMLIVDDAESLALDLPKTYGTDDFPVIVQDRDMQADGTFRYSLSHMERMQGKKGNTILVNGVLDSVLDVQAKEVRLRLLNGSNSRIYNFALSGSTPFKLIATEQGLLAAPVPLTSITMSPGERAEIVVDLTALQGSSLSLLDLNTGMQLMQLKVNQAATAVTTTPSVLSTTLAPLTAAQSVKTRPFILSMGQGKVYINNKQMAMTRIDEAFTLNAIEILDIQNTSNMDHNFHIHGAYFQILSRNGAAPKAYETGLKDTVYLPANAKVQVIIQFTDHTAAATAPYMYHCHILEHEDAGMMGQLTVA
ncbi:MAG: multicopper oxidase domain-containing protein [Mariprofundaceae bacterium]|nr:multicopper oxidase domain-containing protein [Mariprofundaceae bacterium]